MRSAINDYGDTNFITGMRAFAAFGVVLIHSGGAGLRSLGDIGNNLADVGKTGVYVFFVISGFSVAASFAASNGYLDYLGKRLWRVAPLYFLWIALASKNLWLPALQGEAGLRGEDLYNILMHLSFLSFLDYKIANSILSVEWSISVEVFWYFVVPLLIAGIHGKKTVFISIIAALLLYRYAVIHSQWLPVPAADAPFALHVNPITYALSYCLGVSAYKLRPTLKRPERLTNLILVLVVVLLGAFVISMRAVKSY